MDTSPNAQQSEVLGASRPGRRRLVALAAPVFAMALLVASCSGSDSEGDAGSVGGSSADPTEIDAANCPVAALDAAAEPIEVTVWHAYTTLTKDALEAAAVQYNASQSKVKVTVEAQGTYEELLKKYEDSLGNPASLPDVVFAEDTTLQFMADSGSIVAAGDCVAADPDAGEFYDGLLPAVQNAYSIEGVLWPAAFGVSMPIMYLNKDHLTAAGLDPENPPATLDEVRSAAEAIKAAAIPGVEAPLVMQLYGWYPENWLTGAQTAIVDEGNGHDALATTSEFDNDSTTEIFGWLQTMENDGLLKAYPNSSGIDQFLAMANRSSSILIDGSRAITTVNAIVQNSYAGDQIEGAEGIQVDGLNLGVAPVPGLDAAGQGAVAGSAAYLVAGPDDASIAAGWDFLTYFNTTAVQVEWTLKGSYLPVTTTVQSDPAITAYFANDPAGQWLGIVNKQLLGVDPDFPGPSIGPYNQFRTGLHAALESVVLNDGDVATTIGEFDAQFQAELDAYAADVGG